MMVIEREPAVRQLVKEILQRAGFSVIQARNGESAVRLYEQRRGEIDLLVIDGQPPELKELSKRYPGMKMLGLSGVGGSEFPAGMPVLCKPFAPEALVEAVRSLLKSKAGSGGRKPREEKIQKKGDGEETRTRLDY
ncbi:MAG TPA: hypothetical protein PKW45_04680 [Bryobacteraceae bacterium]|nr:hypothetical protein [Bryobacteraceae bacterium]